MLPVQDLQRVRGFYEDALGFKPVFEDEGAVYYECAQGMFSIFVSGGASDGSFTQMSFDCQDLDAEMADLRSRGVTFEEYDLPGLKTENGVAQMGDGGVCWFKDPAGNLLALAAMGNVP